MVLSQRSGRTALELAVAEGQGDILELMRVAMEGERVDEARVAEAEAEAGQGAGEASASRARNGANGHGRTHEPASPVRAQQQQPGVVNTAGGPVFLLLKMRS